jgi:hypothetical protein
VFPELGGPYLLDARPEEPQQHWTGMGSGATSLTGWLQANGALAAYGYRFPPTLTCKEKWSFGTPFLIAALASPARETHGSMSATGFAAVLWTTGTINSGSVYVRVSY